MGYISACKTAMLLAVVAFGTMAVAVEAQDLPMRSSPKPYVSSHVPHVQVGVVPNPAISKELLRHVAGMPGIEIGGTVMSLPGAWGVRLTKDVELARPDLEPV